MFVLKKIVGHLFFPVPLLCLLLILGMFCLWRQRLRWTSALLGIAAAGLILLGYRPLPHAMIASLEQTYAPLNGARLARLQTGDKAIRYIVVLGGGQNEAPGLPPSSRLVSASLGRLTEGIRLSRCFPVAKLLLSGGKPFSSTPEAVTMAQAAQALGVPRSRILLEDQSLDTDDEARLIKPVVGQAPFLLVTSASHMPRAMGLFRHYGMAPIAAPADYLSPDPRERGPLSYLPSANNLRTAERAVYEYLGLLAARMNGKSP